MSKHKYTDRICAAVIIIAMILTVLFMNGTSLGLQAVVDEDSETFTGDTNFTENDLNGDWDTAGATRITLLGDSAQIKGSGAYFSDGEVVIKNGGNYVITGELTDGSIVVDAYQSSKVWIMLDGVSVNASDDAALKVQQADKVFLTLASGSENTLSSGDTFSDEALEDGVNAAVFSHDDLTINGSGSLTVTAGYKHGIVSKDDLVLAGGTISVTAAADGLHANDSICLTGTDLTIEAGDDAIHCDTRIYYLDGELLINACYEGIEAPQIEIAGGILTIYASDDGINANGGSSDMGFGGGMMMPGGAAMNPGTDFNTADSAGSEGEAGSADGAGNEEAADKKTAENQTSDDETSGDETATVLISGGEITIINTSGMDADGIDSNGDLIITGGTVFVSMNNSGGNNALDYGSENGGQLLINGGTVIAAAGSSMLESVSDQSEQASIVYVTESEAAAGSVITLTDASGSELISETIPCAFTSLILSTPALTQGETYELTIGEVSETLTLDSIVTSGGSYTGSAGFAGGMGNPGGMGNAGDGTGNVEGMGNPGGMRHMQGAGDASMPQPGEMPQGDGTFPEAMSEGEFPTPGEMPQGDGTFPKAMSEGDFPTPGEMPQGEGTFPEAMSEGDVSETPEASEEFETESAQQDGTQQGGMQQGGMQQESGQQDGTQQQGTQQQDMRQQGMQQEGTQQEGIQEDGTQQQGMQQDGMQQRGMPQEMDAERDDAGNEQASTGSGQSLSSFGSDVWMLTGLSVLVLLAGLIFAIAYRRR